MYLLRPCLSLLFTILLGGPLWAQPEVSWWTVDGGGQSSSAGGFEVTGTIGQPDAGDLAGGSFAVSGGFWTSENPFVPVELLGFEIVDNRSEIDQDPAAGSREPSTIRGEQLSCRQPPKRREEDASQRTTR